MYILVIILFLEKTANKFRLKQAFDRVQHVYMR